MGAQELRGSDLGMEIRLCRVESLPGAALDGVDLVLDCIDGSRIVVPHF